MIKFNDTYSFEKDQYCWHLHEKYIGQDKHHQDKEFTRTTYHPSLQFICRHLIDKECGKCESLEQIIELLQAAEAPNKILEIGDI
tara:strand:+ start:146 stop:400 length:255 start_codon:yes stop_codon:yes gene_type:complete